MNADWPSVALVDLLEDGALSYGVVQPGRDDPSGVPIVRVKDLSDGRIDGSSPMRVAPSVSARHSRTQLKGGELLLSVVGSVGETAVVPPSFEGWNVARAVAVLRPSGVSAEWLQLVFQGANTREYFAGVLNTTVQATLNLADLKRAGIPMPCASVRGAITDVIGALDDKVAANERTMRSCQELASALFERASDAPSKIAETFVDIAMVGGGGTPRTAVDEYWDGDISWATPKDLTSLRAPYLRSTARSITGAGLAACSAHLYPAGSILMTSRATIGAFAVARVPVAVNQGFIVVNAKNPLHQWWLFHDMVSRVDEFLTFANGATFLELPRGKFRSFPVHLPDEEILNDFNQKVAPLHEIAATVVEENERLAATRYELLPLLMSGKVRVKDAEKVVEEVV